jgi:zinc protease
LGEVLKEKLPYYAVPNLAEEERTIETSWVPAEKAVYALQLIYLNFTTSRKDPVAFEDWKKTALAEANKETVKSYAKDFEDMIKAGQLGEDALEQKSTKQELAKVRMDKVFQIYKDNFSDPSGFNFIVCGNYDEAVLEPLLVKYLGGIPSNRPFKQAGIYKKTYVVKGKLSKTYYGGNADRSEVDLNVGGQYEYNAKNNLLLDILGHALNIKIVERVREKEGGSYIPRAQIGYSRQPEGRYSFNIHFDCAPDKTDYLIDAALDEVEKLRGGSFDEELLNKARAAQMAGKEKDSKMLWSEYLDKKYHLGEDPPTPGERRKIIDDISVQDIQAAATRYFNQDNLQRFVWLPEKFRIKE